MRVLLIVDVQNDFCPFGALPVPDGDKVVPVINKIQSEFDLVVATQDWHPHDHASFAENHGKRPFSMIQIDGKEQILWPVHCVQNTEGADFVPLLDRSKIQKVVRKGTDKDVDSYSGFFDNDHKTSTRLDQYLNEKGTKKLFIAGLATDYCVKYTALDACELGFDTSVIVDACKGISKSSVDKALDELKAKNITLMESVDIG